ncbi:MAG: succinate dehydrogenase/fumarate reductase cytochrome b subunit [Desulfuromonas sp.]|uniref:succinate dehydrogenase cytochrome b subunit n=1 Tax=Desulfuromonas sp. TaxID=892 RepID=UPI000CA674BC|nr:succinate dehydrogenase cytochrome b subunit [Desulfuromonas sp.]PLX85998.1 MAG: succinate dehydrogenase/fumarate reductase cytochrome b subunit [Desulfuromonas sp.]
MLLTNSSVGRKILMACTGLILISFIIVHLLGNSSIFAGPDGINAYAEHLHALGPLVWIFRLVMLAVFALHIVMGVQLTLENRAARPGSYVQKQNLRTTIGARTMIWSGLVLLIFLIYHLLHFTVQVSNPEISAHNLPLDAMNRLDVFSMVVLSFQKLFIALVYVAAMVFLFLHVSHGFGSFFQTMGWNNDRTIDGIGMASKAFGFVVLLGYIAIPVLIIVGFVKI